MNCYFINHNNSTSFYTVTYKCFVCLCVFVCTRAVKKKTNIYKVHLVGIVLCNHPLMPWEPGSLWGATNALKRTLRQIWVWGLTKLLWASFLNCKVRIKSHMAGQLGGLEARNGHTKWGSQSATLSRQVYGTYLFILPLQQSSHCAHFRSEVTEAQKDPGTSQGPTINCRTGIQAQEINSWLHLPHRTLGWPMTITQQGEGLTHCSKKALLQQRTTWDEN